MVVPGKPLEVGGIREGTGTALFSEDKSPTSFPNVPGNMTFRATET